MVEDDETSIETKTIAIKCDENGAEENDCKAMFTQAEFEAFMTRERPFLNSDLRLLDLANLLNTNRTYLSNFINNTYGVNFCRLINHFRLSELERLKQDDKTKGLTEKDLAEMVGFGSYRNYKRYNNQNKIKISVTHLEWYSH